MRRGCTDDGQDPRTRCVPPHLLEDLPEHAHPWYDHNADRVAREAREDALRELLDVLGRIIAAALTPRQYEVFRLYYFKRFTEVQVAEELRIAQPTVSQHLAGKKRGCRKVGGMLRRLGRGIRRAVNDDGLTVQERHIVAALNELLAQPLTRRQASRLFKSLGSPPLTDPSDDMP